MRLIWSNMESTYPIHFTHNWHSIFPQDPKMPHTPALVRTTIFPRPQTFPTPQTPHTLYTTHTHTHTHAHTKTFQHLPDLTYSYTPTPPAPHISPRSLIPTDTSYTSGRVLCTVDWWSLFHQTQTDRQNNQIRTHYKFICWMIINIAVLVSSIKIWYLKITIDIKLELVWYQYSHYLLFVIFEIVKNPIVLTRSRSEIDYHCLLVEVFSSTRVTVCAFSINVAASIPIRYRIRFFVSTMWSCYDDSQVSFVVL